MIWKLDALSFLCLKFACSLTEEARLIRVLILVQRGDYTETHTKREPILWSAGRRSRELFSFRSGFYLKVKQRVLFLMGQTFATVNIRVWRSEVKNNTLLKTVLFYTRKSKTIHFWKPYCFTQGSQKQYTFENCVVLHKEGKNNTFTIDTYNRHSQ